MGIESGEKFNKKEVNINEFERQLDMSIFAVQLEFLRRLKLETGEDMERLFSKYSNVFEFVGHGINMTAQEEKIVEQAIAELKSDILSLGDVDSDDWFNKALQEIKKFYKKIDEQIECKESKEELRLGAFVYNFGEVRSDEDNNYDLKKGDNYLELHFPVNIIDKLKGRENLNLKDSLQKVAEFIVLEHPEIQAVVGASWLMSHPLAEKLGFKKVSGKPSTEDAFKEPGYWLQLIDAQGNIKKDAVEFLYKNHKLPYDFSYGKIETEDFLRRYLPDNFKNKKIVLKEPRREYLDVMNKLSSEWSYFESQWDDIPEEEVINKFYDLAPSFIALLKKAGVLESFMSHLKQLKQRGAGSDILKKSLESEEITRPLTEYIDKNLRFKEKRVEI